MTNELQNATLGREEGREKGKRDRGREGRGRESDREGKESGEGEMDGHRKGLGDRERGRKREWWWIIVRRTGTSLLGKHREKGLTQGCLYSHKGGNNLSMHSVSKFGMKESCLKQHRGKTRGTSWTGSQGSVIDLVLRTHCKNKSSPAVKAFVHQKEIIPRGFWTPGWVWSKGSYHYTERTVRILVSYSPRFEVRALTSTRRLLLGFWYHIVRGKNTCIRAS